MWICDSIDAIVQTNVRSCFDTEPFVIELLQLFVTIELFHLNCHINILFGISDWIKKKILFSKSSTHNLVILEKWYEQTCKKMKTKSYVIA